MPADPTRAYAHFLAFDLGASSGRAVLGAFDGERLRLEELHRFANGPVAVGGHLYWDILRLFEEFKIGLAKCAARGVQLEGIGIDAWGVDAALLTAGGELLGLPYHYRDPRTHAVYAENPGPVPRAEIYATTGIQFMPINTLYQLVATAREQPRLLDVADRLLFIPDLLTYWLTGVSQSEYTIASTSQLLDAHARDWARGLIARLGLPDHIFPPLVAPGTLVGPLLPAVAAETGLKATTFIATASHDTGAAVAAVPWTGRGGRATSGGPASGGPAAPAGTARGDGWAYISSGTWSLVGAEVPQPICTPAALAHNFTNEGGVGGTIRLLRNVAGLWLVQECKRTWDARGDVQSYEGLTRLAHAAPARRAWINPDDPVFAEPGDMPARIAAWCSRTGQPAPESPGAMVRCILESLALKYRVRLANLQEVMQGPHPGSQPAAQPAAQPLRVLHVVGGGCHNALLCQLTADVTGLPVIAGPAEATAAGNILVQALARGHVGSAADIRAVTARSTTLRKHEPRDSEAWAEPIARFEALLAHAAGA